MSEALALAKRGTGHVSPNPLVGCVIVKNNVIIGRGWHKKLGGPHAEVHALNDAGSEASGATAYVTLEPCAHVGKTPPCANALINANITTVVIAALDPNPTASGGVEALKKAGIEVITGVMKSEAEFQNRAFIHHIKYKRPWVIAKTATSLDGRIATHTGHSQWITGSAARKRGHDLRQYVDAIMIGADTLRKDDPSLTVRECWDSELSAIEAAHPLRIIVSGSGQVPLQAKALNGSLPGQTLVATSNQMPTTTEQQLNDAGVEVWRLPATDEQIHIPALLEQLAPRCQSVMIEGGAKLLGAFADAQCIDELWAFIAPKIIGGATAPGSISGRGADRLEHSLTLHNVCHESLDADWLIRGMVNRGEHSE